MEGNENKPFWQYQASTKATVIFFVSLIGCFAIFMAWLSYDSSPAKYSGKRYTPSTVSSGSAVSAPAVVAPDLTVTNNVIIQGEYLIVTTRVKNTNAYSVNKKLKLQVKDSVGVERYLDLVYVNLQAGETGKTEVAKKASDFGPGPYKITYEWQ